MVFVVNVPAGIVTDDAVPQEISVAAAPAAVRQRNVAVFCARFTSLVVLCSDIFCESFQEKVAGSAFGTVPPAGLGFRMTAS